MIGYGWLIWFSLLQLDICSETISQNLLLNCRFLQRNYTVYRGFVTLQKKTEIIHPPDKDEDGEDAEPTVETKYEPLCELNISIPKVNLCNGNILACHQI